MNLTELKSRCEQGIPSRGSRQRSISLSFPALSVYLHSFAHGPFHHLQSQPLHCSKLFCSHIFFSGADSPARRLSLLKTFLITLGHPYNLG